MLIKLVSMISTQYGGFIFVEKGLGMHVQRMFEMSRVYTLAEILSKMFGKIQREIGGLIYDRDLTTI